jgi:hypothetical protein
MSDKSSILTSICKFDREEDNIYLAFKLFSPVEVFLGALKFENNPEGQKLHERIVDFLLDNGVVLTASSKNSFDSVRNANLAHLRNKTFTGSVHLNNYTSWSLSDSLPEVIGIFKSAITRVLIDNKGLAQ